MIGLILCLIVGLAPTAAGVSVKLRGKIVLGGILSGLAYGTHKLVTRDRRAAENLRVHLGTPDRVIQFERGFDRWRINVYGERCYLFRNNRSLRTAPCISLPPRERGDTPQTLARLEVNTRKFVAPFLIDTFSSRNPRWSRLYLSRPHPAPQFVSSYLYRLADEHSLGLQRSLSHSWSQRSHLTSSRLP